MWLERLGMIDSVDRKIVETEFTPAQLDVTAAQARDLREWLRPVIAAWAAAGDKSVPDDVVERLNAVLDNDHRFARIRYEAGGVIVHDLRHWLRCEQLLIPPIATVAELLVGGDQQLVRNCEGCSIWFYDHTKAHRRRWCSMALCGNRAKARSHRQRVATAKIEQPTHVRPDTDHEHTI
jgi:predicted RNA-binding Zn ribbon-like protein